jgi:hypothetical protein
MSSDQLGRLATIQPSKDAATISNLLPPELYALNGSDRLQPLIQAVRAIAAGSSAIRSERVLAGQFNVKRHQLRRALEALRGSGEIAPAWA